MKIIIIAVAAVLFSIRSYSQAEIKVTDAKEHVGDTVKICTKIFGTFVNDNAKEDGTYLFAGGNFPDAPLTILIRNENRKYFDYKPEKDLKDRNVCITGRIELVKDRPQIFVTKQSQIEIQ
jgi:hypothetical protein